MVELNVLYALAAESGYKDLPPGMQISPVIAENSIWKLMTFTSVW